MKHTIFIIVIVLFAHNTFAQIHVSLDTIEISPLVYFRNAIEMGTDEILVSEYERPQVRVKMHVNGLEINKMRGTYDIYGSFTYHNRTIRRSLFLEYYDEQSSLIILTNPNFFDGVLYQDPIAGVEDYTQDICDILPSFRVVLEIRNGIKIAESGASSTIILQRGD